MLSRRDFLKISSMAGGATLLNVRPVWARSLTADYFGLHEFVESNPDAVFVLRTTVDAIGNADAIRTAGYQLGKTLFVGKAGPSNAFPLSAPVAVKPNMTARGKWQATASHPYSAASTKGTQTDSDFVEGVINSIKDLGVPGGQVYIRETNAYEDFADGGFIDMAQRTGAVLENLSYPVAQLPPSKIQWMDVPAGVWYNRIPYLWPVNAPEACIINIAKFKSHSMGMTLTAKNMQGTNAKLYVQHCRALSAAVLVDPAHVQPGASATIQANHQAHVSQNIPRWNTPGTGEAGGLWMETWASRCLDNHSVTKPFINIIEGVYGREGPFLVGPGADGYGIDVLTNVVIFGKNPFHTDIVGTYLAGHEPGNFGLFHMALERGLSKFLNPRDIPVYEWKLDGSIPLTPLVDFPRQQLRTLYLKQSGEAEWHMVDEPFTYPPTAVAETDMVPDAFVLSQNYPNPFNPSTAIQYEIPSSGTVRLDIFNVHGEVVDRLVDSAMPAGRHVAVWRAGGRPSGTYFYRLTFGGFTRTKPMVLMR